MPQGTIYIKGQRYYYFNTYTSKEKAFNTAKSIRQASGTRWFILPSDSYLFVRRVYHLYFNKIQ